MSHIYLFKNTLYNIICKKKNLYVYNFSSFYYIFLICIIICFTWLLLREFRFLDYFYIAHADFLAANSLHVVQDFEEDFADLYFMHFDYNYLDNFRYYENNRITVENFSLNDLIIYYEDYMKAFYSIMGFLIFSEGCWCIPKLLWIHYDEIVFILNWILFFFMDTINLIFLDIGASFFLYQWSYILIWTLLAKWHEFNLLYYDLIFPWFYDYKAFIIYWHTVNFVMDVHEYILDYINNLYFYYLFSIIENKLIFYHLIFSFLEVFIIFIIIIIIFYRKSDIFFFKYNLTILFNCIFLYFILIYYISSKFYFSSYYFFLNFFYLNLFNLNVTFGLDNITLIFILLTCFLFLISFLVSLYNIKYNFKFFILNLIFLEFLVILTFLSVNLFFFYIFFELSLIPMFFIIGFWGSRQRKLYAVYQFFFYTLLGSIFLLSAVIIIYSTFNTLDIQVISNLKLNYDRQLILWLLLFLGFSTKIPLVPFHVWLPEAHVEAPTAGSIILAGILLKLGTYGILRFILPVFYYANYFYLPYIYTLCIISIIYISFIALIQIDLKKIIAYSSILHMNFIILGLFSFTVNGLIGSIFLMISHGLISAGLFICVGILYDRYKTRNIIYYGGVVDYMPLFSFCFFILVLSNIGFPLTSNFIGEVLVCIGLIESNFFLVLLILSSTFFSAIYSVWLYNRVIFGTNKYLLQVSDLSEREFFILASIIFFIILLGVRPNLLLNLIEFPIFYILEYINY